MDLATGRNLVVTRSDVLTAHDRIAGSIRRTPTLRITDPTRSIQLGLLAAGLATAFLVGRARLRKPRRPRLRILRRFL